MLRVDTVGYNCTATSVQDDVVLATFNFNADNYNNFYLNVTYHDEANLKSTVVDTDFAAFKARVADAIDAAF